MSKDLHRRAAGDTADDGSSADGTLAEARRSSSRNVGGMCIEAAQAHAVGSVSTHRSSNAVDSKLGQDRRVGRRLAHRMWDMCRELGDLEVKKGNLKLTPR